MVFWPTNKPVKSPTQTLTHWCHGSYHFSISSYHYSIWMSHCTTRDKNLDMRIQDSESEWTLTAVLLMLHPEPVATVTTTTWPEETELCYAPGGTRVMLTIQCQLLRTVIQDSIEILRATLIFENAFPEGDQGFYFAHHTLVSAAEKQLPVTLSIHNWLLQDEDYIRKIIPLVTAYDLTLKDQLTFFKATRSNPSVP